ncbi:MAG: hypothetical protein EXS30_05970 [Pedosphaera sp.]|nr:hypothetical protein [Pedosphaera sp.]
MGTRRRRPGAGKAGIPSDREARRKDYAERIGLELRRTEKVPEDYGRLVPEGLKIQRSDEEELALRRKRGEEKVKLARRQHAQTTKTLAWIAPRLSMGSWTYTAILIYENGAKKKTIVRAGTGLICNRDQAALLSCQALGSRQHPKSARKSHAGC